MGGWNYHSAQLVQRGIGYPIFRAALEDDHYKIALFYAQLLKRAGQLVAQKGDVLKGIFALLPLVVAPDQRPLIGLKTGVFIHNVKTEIEIFRYAEGQFLLHALIIIKISV